MLRTRLIPFLIAGGLMVSGCGFFKKNPDIENKKADFELTSAGLIDECEKSDTAVNRKYNSKVLEIKGKVSGTIPGDSITSVIMDEGKNTTITIEMYSRFNDVAKNLQKGDEVTIKALYVTYLPADPILISMGDSTARGDVKLKKGSLVK